jgi:hypothetical protein
VRLVTQSLDLLEQGGEFLGRVLRFEDDDHEVCGVGRRGTDG